MCNVLLRRFFSPLPIKAIRALPLLEFIRFSGSSTILITICLDYYRLLNSTFTPSWAPVYTSRKAYETLFFASIYAPSSFNRQKSTDHKGKVKTCTMFPNSTCQCYETGAGKHTPSQYVAYVKNFLGCVSHNTHSTVLQQEEGNVVTFFFYPSTLFQLE